MSAFLTGAVSFAAFALSDYLSAVRRTAGGSLLFGLGSLLLAASTALLVLHQGAAVLFGPLWPLRWLCVAVAVVMLVLLAYTLTFALHAGGSDYQPPQDGRLPLVDCGVYALCRHPGVLWLGGFYFALWGALGGFWLAAAFVTYTVLDLLYVLWQDRCVFPHSISGYTGYRARVPFLLPSRRSLRCCLLDFGLCRQSGEQSTEKRERP